LFWNTPSNTMPLNLLKERWNLGTWKGWLMRRRKSLALTAEFQQNQ
jgi:hypothetical protein